MVLLEVSLYLRRLLHEVSAECGLRAYGPASLTCFFSEVLHEEAAAQSDAGGRRQPVLRRARRPDAQLHGVRNGARRGMIPTRGASGACAWGEQRQRTTRAVRGSCEDGALGEQRVGPVSCDGGALGSGKQMPLVC
jgi:hypothetical protein